MNFNAIRNLVSITLLSSACLTANAADTGFYVGGGLGSSYASKFCNEGEDDRTSCDDKSFSWKLLGGYQFSPIFGLEAFYVNLGNIKASGESSQASGEVTAEMSAIGLAATAGWPINQQLSIFGKAGLAHAKTTGKITVSETVKGKTVNASESIDSNTNNFMAGAGIKYAINENLAVRAEWEYFKDVFNGNTAFNGTGIHLFSASLTYSF